MSEHGLTITLRAEDLDPGQGGAVWVRLEPEAARGDVATVAQAAAVIDELFRIEPCAGGLGTGGLEVEVGPDGAIEPPVDEQQFDQVTKNTLGIGVCQAAAAGWSWQARVRVLRSHPDRPYVLRIDRGEVIATERVDEQVDTAVLFADSNTATLELPVAGAVAGSWGSVVTRSGVEPSWRISGATVSLDRRATGQLNLSYGTTYDLVTIKVSGRAGTEQLQQALCLCFYERLVADCTLEPPEVDDRDLARLQCGTTGSIDDGSGDCYELLTRRTTCACSGEVYASTEVEVGVPCPEGVTPGRHFIGSRTIDVGTIMCPGERDEDLYDPEVQRALCCRLVAPPAPCVRQEYVLQGGRAIEHGVDHYISLYGPTTKLVGIAPPGGNCGKLIIELARVARDCCALADPVGLPVETVSAPDAEILVTARPGVPPYSWTANGGVKVDGVFDDTTTALCRTAPDFCGTGEIIVMDSCGTAATMAVRSTDGQWADRGGDQCMDLPGFVPGAADDDGPTDQCGDFSLPNVVTSGRWKVVVSYGAQSGAGCPAPEVECPRRFISMLRGLGKSPEQALCERYGCLPGTIAGYGDGCCTVQIPPYAPNFFAFWQVLGGAYEWVC